MECGNKSFNPCTDIVKEQKIVDTDPKQLEPTKKSTKTKTKI